MSCKILIIDDDHDILETTGSILAHEGFEIHSADSVERGLELVDSLDPFSGEFVVRQGRDARLFRRPR